MAKHWFVGVAVIVLGMVAGLGVSALLGDGTTGFSALEMLIVHLLVGLRELLVTLGGTIAAVGLLGSLGVAIPGRPDGMKVALVGLFIAALGAFVWPAQSALLFPSAPELVGFFGVLGQAVSSPVIVVGAVAAGLGFALIMSAEIEDSGEVVEVGRPLG